MEILKQFHAGYHENRAHHKRAYNSIEQHLVLGFRRDFERLKNDQKYKNVIDAERFFDQVTSQEFQAGLWTLREVDPDVEEQRNRNPGHALKQRFLQPDRMRFPVKHAKVNHQRNNHGQQEDQPEMCGGPEHDLASLQRADESNRIAWDKEARYRTPFQLVVAAQSGMPDNAILKSTSLAILADLLD